MLTSGLAQHVPHTAQGLDQPRLRGVHLAAQVGHIGLDHVHLATEVVIPDVVEDARLAEHRARVGHQVAQQLELRRRQGDQLACFPHLVGVVVQLDVREGDPRGARKVLQPRCGAAPPEFSRDHLLEAERFGHVVVTAESQPGDLVLDGIAGGEKQRGAVHSVGTQPTQQPKAVHPGHHHVQHHQVRPEGAGDVEGLHTVGRGRHLEADEAQAGAQQVDDVRFVVDHQDPCLGHPRRSRPFLRYHCLHEDILNLAAVRCLQVGCELAVPQKPKAARRDGAEAASRRAGVLLSSAK